MTQPEKTMELPDDLKQLGDEVAVRIAEKFCHASLEPLESESHLLYEGRLILQAKDIAQQELSPLLQRLAAAQKCVEALGKAQRKHRLLYAPRQEDLKSYPTPYDEALSDWAEANKETPK